MKADSEQKKVKKTPDQKLTDIAMTMMQKLDMLSGWKYQPTRGNVYSLYGPKIRDRLLQMSPAIRGEVADFYCGDFPPTGGSLFCLNRESGGRMIVTEMATQVIVDRMHGLLQEILGGRIPTIHPIRKIPSVPSATAGMPASGLHSRWPKGHREPMMVWKQER